MEPNSQHERLAISSIVQLPLFVEKSLSIENNAERIMIVIVIDLWCYVPHFRRIVGYLYRRIQQYENLIKFIIHLIIKQLKCWMNKLQKIITCMRLTIRNRCVVLNWKNWVTRSGELMMVVGIQSGKSIKTDLIKQKYLRCKNILCTHYFALCVRIRNFIQNSEFPHGAQQQ